MGQYRSSLKTIRHEAIAAAKDLGYDEEYIKDLKAAKSEGEIERIMITARHGGHKKKCVTK